MRIIELYRDAGWSMARVAGLLEIHTDKVRACLRANGIPIRPRTYYLRFGMKLSHHEIARTAFLYERCLMSEIEISRHLGIAKSTVHYRLTGAGVKLRSKSEGLRLAASKRRERSNDDATELRRIAVA